MKKSIIFSAILILFIFSVFFVFLKIKEKEKNKQLKLALISDMHKCLPFSPEIEKDELLKDFMTDVETKKAEAIINLGDLLSYRVGKCHETAEIDLKQTIDYFSNKNFPFFSVLGDHDIDNPPSFDSWLRTNRLNNSYYSVELKNFKIIILDTTTGGERTRNRCSEDENCQKLKLQYELYRDILKDQEKFDNFSQENNISRESLEWEKDRRKDSYFKEEKEIRNSRSFDQGKISPVQLDWLRNELKKTKKEKVIVASHHPLFRLDTGEKIYEISNSEEVQKILRESGKKIIAVSGDAHIWHEEEKDGIKYFIINRLSNDQGSWAFLEWDKDEVRLEKIGH